MANKPKAYRADAPAYVDGVLYKAGEVFVTDKPKSEHWEPVNPTEKAAADAGKEIKGDVDYSTLSVSELRATAAALGVNLGDVKSKDEILRVLAARDDPTR